MFTPAVFYFTTLELLLHTHFLEFIHYILTFYNFHMLRKLFLEVSVLKEMEKVHREVAKMFLNQICVW
jgi:hypothetical protein